MDWNTLKTELQDAKYSGMTDQEAADSLNTVSIDKVGAVSLDQALIWASKNAVFSALTAHASDSGGLGDICTGALKLLEGAGSELDLSNADVSAMLAALVAAGVLTQAQSDSLTTLATTKISRREQLGLDTIQAGDVAHARTL